MDFDKEHDMPVDTGLVTATVTPIAAVSRPPQPAAAVAPVPPYLTPARAAAGAQMPDNWTLHDVAALVGDVAQNMYDMPYLLKKHGLTPKQYATLEKNPFFQRALEAEIITWQGANSIQKRLALEAAIAVESSLPDVAARMTNKNEPLGEVVALMKLFSEMAGVVGNKNPVNSENTAKFRIVINLGGESLAREASSIIDVTGAVTDKAPAP